MNDEEPPRSAAARQAAELALVRVVHHYGRETLHSDKAIANWAPGHYCDGSTSGSCCGPTRAKVDTSNSRSRPSTVTTIRACAPAALT